MHVSAAFYLHCNAAHQGGTREKLSGNLLCGGQGSGCMAVVGGGVVGLFVDGAASLSVKLN